jgi:hypothetical protein
VRGSVAAVGTTDLVALVGRTVGGLVLDDVAFVPDTVGLIVVDVVVVVGDVVVLVVVVLVVLVVLVVVVDVGVVVLGVGVVVLVVVVGGVGVGECPGLFVVRVPDASGVTTGPCVWPASACATATSPASGAAARTMNAAPRRRASR